MTRQSVSSSNLRSVGYDNPSSTLEIEFNSGSIYQYLSVPANVHVSLMRASSHGTYFNANIKNVYRFRQIK